MKATRLKRTTAHGCALFYSSTNNPNTRTRLTPGPPPLMTDVARKYMIDTDRRFSQTAKYKFVQTANQNQSSSSVMNLCRPQILMRLDRK